MTNVQAFPPTPAQAHPPAGKHIRSIPHASVANTQEHLLAPQGDSLTLSSQQQGKTVTPHFGRKGHRKSSSSIPSGKYYKGAGQGLSLLNSYLDRSYQYDTRRYNSRDVFHIGQDRRGLHHYDVYESPDFRNDYGRYGGYAFSRATHRTPSNYFRH